MRSVWWISKEASFDAYVTLSKCFFFFFAFTFFTVLPHRNPTEFSGECVLVAPVPRTAVDDGVAEVLEMAQMYIGVFCAVKAVLDRQWGWIKGSFFYQWLAFYSEIKESTGLIISNLIVVFPVTVHFFPSNEQREVASFFPLHSSFCSSCIA